MLMPSAKKIADRFVKYAPGRSDRYEEGVRSPGKDWKKETLDAEKNYEDGVKAAISRKSFGKGVTRCGSAKQQAKTILNLSRWSEGISNAGPEMEERMEKVVAVMSAVKLPPAYPKGDVRNYERVKAIGTALRKAKEEGRL